MAMLMMRESLKRLENLYKVTGHDWVLEVRHILTEPAMPTVNIRPEDLHITRYRVDEESIEHAIAVAADLVYRDVILGEPIKSRCPFTEEDDAAWLEELARLRDEKRKDQR